MAKTFSINKALHDAFGMCLKNWQLLLMGGALVSAGWLVDYHTVGHFQRIRHFVKTELPESVNAQEAVAKIKTFGRSLAAQGGHHESLLIWLLMLYLHLGLVRLCLQLIGGKKGNLNLFVTGPWDFLRYFGAMLVLVLLLVGFVLGVIAVCALLKWFQLPMSVIFLLAFALTMVFVIYMLHFMFLQYCAAEKPKSVMAILKCSKSKVCGVLAKLFGFIIIFHMVMELVKLLLAIPAHVVGRFVPISGIACFLICMLTAPILAMGYASVYRQLK